MFFCWCFKATDKVSTLWAPPLPVITDVTTRGSRAISPPLQVYRGYFTPFITGRAHLALYLFLESNLCNLESNRAHLSKPYHLSIYLIIYLSIDQRNLSQLSINQSINQTI